MKTSDHRLHRGQYQIGFFVDHLERPAGVLRIRIWLIIPSPAFGKIIWAPNASKAMGVVRCVASIGKIQNHFYSFQNVFWEPSEKIF